MIEQEVDIDPARHAGLRDQDAASHSKDSCVAVAMAMFRAWRHQVEEGHIVPLCFTFPGAAMSNPVNMPPRRGSGSGDHVANSPPYGKSPRTHFLLPSPIPTRRNRTPSMSERAMAGPTHKGIIKDFCRDKGHGYIKPNDGSELMFLHISDIDDDYVPHDGDEVEYKTILIPPKLEKIQAVHVRIIKLTEGVKHERWDQIVHHGTPH